VSWARHLTGLPLLNWNNDLFNAKILAVHNKAMQSQYNATTVKCTLKKQRRSKFIRSTAPYIYKQEIAAQILLTRKNIKKRSIHTVTHTKNSLKRFTGSIRWQLDSKTEKVTSLSLGRGTLTNKWASTNVSRVRKR